MWSFIARTILRNRLAFLIGLALMTVFMAWHAMHVKLSYEFARILPEDDKDYVEYKKFKEKFGEDGAVLVVGIQSEDFFTLPVFNDWKVLGDNIKKIDGVEEVVSQARIYHLLKNDSLEKFEFKPVVPDLPATQAEVDSLKNLILSFPFYEGLIYNSDSHATLMAITLDKNKLNTKNRIEVVDSIKLSADEFGKKHNLKVHISGLPYIRTAITRKVTREMILFIILALLITSLILYVFFRSFKVVLYALLVVAIGVIWSFAVIELLDYKLSILTALIPPLIIVIGVPNCILLLNKYHEEFRRHGNKMKALSRMIEKIGLTTFLANVTTSIGFGVFYFTNSRILMEFGLVAFLNVMATYVISLILIPIIFSYLAEPNFRHMKHLEGKFIRKILGKVDYLVHHHRSWIYVSVLVVIAVSIYGTLHIVKVGYIVDDLPKKDPILLDLKFFEKNFNGVLPFEIEVDTKKPNGIFADNAKALYKIKALQKVLAGYPEFSHPVSIVEAIKFTYQAYRDGNPKYFILPAPTELKKLNDYIVNSPQQKGGTYKNLVKSVIDTSRQVTRISVQVADVGSVKMKTLLQELRPRVDSIFNAEEFLVTFTGNSVTNSAGNVYLQKNLRDSVMLAVLLISIIMIMLFMSVRMITVSVLPSIIPLLITGGLMGFFAIALKPSSILIFSIAFGIASDGTVYFLTKYRQEIKIHRNSISKAVSMTIHETGVSMIYTAIILFAGFAIFSASSFGGTAALGTLISLTLLISYTSNLILLPSILLSLEKRLTTKAFLSEPLIQIYDEDEDIEINDLEIRKPEINQ